MRRLLAVAVLGAGLVGTPPPRPARRRTTSTVARQWYLGRDHALETFDAAKQLFTVRVAVIDSGVDLGHPELKNRVVAHRSFVGGTVADTLGHGTFVAGEIAAIADNTIGIAGLAPPARLVVAKVVRDDGTIPPRAEARAIRWAVRQGARVINLSLGSTRDPSDPSVDGYSRAEQQADRVRRPARSARRRGRRQRQRRAREALALGELPGRLSRTCSGSGPTGAWAACRASRTATTATSTWPRPGWTSSRSSRGRSHRLFSGCVEQGYSICGTKDYRHADGTSFSSPQVAAAAALLFGEEAALRPDQVSTILKLNADDATPANGCGDCSPGPDSLSGFGRLDVGAALDALQGAPPAPDRFEPNDDAGVEAATVYHSMSATATLDWWDDPNDVYRIHLARGQRLSRGRARRPKEHRPLARALEAGARRARRRALRPARATLDPRSGRARADSLQGAAERLVLPAGQARAAGLRALPDPPSLLGAPRPGLRAAAVRGCRPSAPAPVRRGSRPRPPR